jgi:flavin reductase (DIM6/NTAB) family NADH-FMN oxidoreductase RutF
MQRQTIDIDTLQIKPHYLFHHQLALLTSGDYLAGVYNTMTIGWGALGTMWSKPFAFVAVRHSRYTYQFMEKYETFTISAFPQQYQAALDLLGTRSGRDGDKISDAGLTPEASIKVAAPSFEEAEIVIECQKTYANDLNPAHFLDESIHKHYPRRDYHRIYYGKIIAVTGIEKYSA